MRVSMFRHDWIPMLLIIPIMSILTIVVLESDHDYDDDWSAGQFVFAAIVTASKQFSGDCSGQMAAMSQVPGTCNILPFPKLRFSQWTGTAFALRRPRSARMGTRCVPMVTQCVAGARASIGCPCVGGRREFRRYRTRTGARRKRWQRRQRRVVRI